MRLKAWPANFAQHVTRDRPDWVKNAALRPEVARGQLMARIDTLRTNLPLDPEQRARITLWPEFRIVATDKVRVDLLAAGLEGLVGGREFDVDRAARFVKQGALELALCAAQLKEVDWSTDEGLKRGRRLHEMLRAGTGCKDLEFVEGVNLGDRQSKNRALGSLWLWFANEFGRSERAWQAYQELLGR